MVHKKIAKAVKKVASKVKSVFVKPKPKTTVRITTVAPRVLPKPVIRLAPKPVPKPAPKRRGGGGVTVTVKQPLTKKVIPTIRTRTVIQTVFVPQPVVQAPIMPIAAQQQFRPRRLRRSIARQFGIGTIRERRQAREGRRLDPFGIPRGRRRLI